MNKQIVERILKNQALGKIIISTDIAQGKGINGVDYMEFSNKQYPNRLNLVNYNDGYPLQVMVGYELFDDYIEIETNTLIGHRTENYGGNVAYSFLCINQHTYYIEYSHITNIAIKQRGNVTFRPMQIGYERVYNKNYWTDGMTF